MGLLSKFANFFRGESQTIEAPPKERSTTIIKSLSDYAITFETFRRVIPPLLLKFPFCAIGFTDEHIRLIWLSTSSDGKVAYQAKESLRWSHNDATLDVASQLRRNYESLLMARDTGSQSVSIGARSGCACMDGIAKRLAPTESMIAAFEGRASSLPVIPSPELPCCFDQEVQTPCQCWVFGKAEWTIGEINKPTSKAHPQEHAAHQNLIELKSLVEFGGKIEPLSENWKTILLENSAKMIGAKINAIIEYQAENKAELDLMLSGASPIAHNPTEELTVAMSMKEMRDMQKRFGLRGHRSKADIAAQIIGHHPAGAEVSELFKKRNIEYASHLKSYISDADSDIEALKEQMCDIYDRIKK